MNSLDNKVEKFARSTYGVLLADPDQHLFVYPLSTKSGTCLKRIVRNRGDIVDQRELTIRPSGSAYLLFRAMSEVGSDRLRNSGSIMNCISPHNRCNAPMGELKQKEDSKQNIDVRCTRVHGNIVFPQTDAG